MMSNCINIHLLEYATPMLTYAYELKQEQRNARNKNLANHLLSVVQSNIGFILKARSNLSESLRKVNALEACKPVEIKSRILRYKDLIKKEKKELVVLTEKLEKKDEKEVKEDKVKTKKEKKKKAKKEEVKVTEEKGDVLEQEDTLTAGLDWSDNEDNVEDESEDDEY